MHDDELTPAERASMGALPRELRPSPDLEERTVRAMRAAGLLRGRAPLRLHVPRLLWVGAAAASFALFVGGFALGAWIESRHTTAMVMAVQQRDAENAAALVQRTGSAYVSALTSLASFADSARSPELAQGREVAVNALHAAARQMVRIAPEDPLTVDILQGMSRAARRDTTSMAAAEPRRVVWF
jgi:hypothetical protein